MSAWEQGIQSIYTFIRRTAEKTDSGICWETIDYENRPQRNYNLFNGVGGIPFFLCDYFRYSGDQEALSLAKGAIEWCKSESVSPPSENEMNYMRGLHTGKVGIAYVQLFYDSLLDRQPSSYCHELANHVLKEPPGPITDLTGGEASNGFYLLKLYQKTADPKYLEGAKRCADWISSTFIQEGERLFCKMIPGEPKQDGRYSLGVSHGMSGVSYFFGFLYQETKEERYKEIAKQLIDTVIGQAIESKGGLNWPVVAGAKELPRCQYSHGAVGIGMVLTRLSELLDRTELSEIALKAGEASYQYGDFRNNLTICTGVSGSGHLMLDLYCQTQDPLWLERAKDFAAIAASYKEETKAGDAWPTDEPGLYSADYLYGASGVGHFFLRIADPTRFNMPLF
ncbi:lanthionine synthetase LanC family protein [Pelagicoccus mobilis]|uniref:Lanthionine synthetase C family protein n=1 Tax=Pelagicoccus mobilis TaxID=415221 RepID=A0A934VR54_9BACT|nr:lanthionine synthetase C family protein [Pelagicoccus mobilis]MBK1877580.1 lanthionine synthetase C family protein [Pelagicoccus mobilis]